MSVLESIRDTLDGAGVSYREVHHQPTRTSEESARARGEEVRIGGKALLIRTGEEFPRGTLLLPEHIQKGFEACLEMIVKEKIGVTFNRKYRQLNCFPEDDVSNAPVTE